MYKELRGEDGFLVVEKGGEERAKVEVREEAEWGNR